MPRIGVLLAQLEDAYQTAIWRGIEARAQARGLGVTCFVGPGDLAFRMADASALDGLIVLATTIGPLPADCAPLPMVSLGQKLPGVPSVTVDPGPGLRHLVQHLVRTHGRRRFALITGPQDHFESQARELAIRQTLAEEGLALDPQLVVRGNFYEASGSDGAKKLLEHGGFDALMALNDRMAFGAYRVLLGGGLRIPEDVSVTGFDDVEKCRHVAPPLTTIDQPLDAMGRLAVDMVIDLLDHKPPTDLVLPCVPVQRWSCGCPPRLEEFSRSATRSRSRAPQEPEAVAHLAQSLAGGEAQEFLLGLAETLGLGAPEVEDALGLVDGLEAQAFPEDPGHHALAEAGRRLAAQAANRSQAARRHAADDRFTAVRNLSARIAGAFGRETLFERLQEGWTSVGVRRGFLVLFEGNQGLPPTSSLVLPRAEGPFPTRSLLPESYGHPWSQGSWILEPLIYQDEPLGYLLLEGTADELSVYGALRDQVASALKGTLLMETLRDHERTLEGQVALRTAELTRANEELTQEVARRRELEKQVQEISDRTMRRIGQDLHDDLCQHLAGVAMLATVVRRTLPPGSEAGSSLDRIGSLLEDSIIRARQIARGLYPPGLEERGLADAVEELVATARLTSTAVLLYETEGDCRGGAPDRRLQMFRIVQESLANALKHSGSDVVRVRLAREPGALVASVTDFGPGLPTRTEGSGLGLGIMRHRAEAAGLELQFDPLSPGLRVVCRWPEESSHG